MIIQAKSKANLGRPRDGGLAGPSGDTKRDMNPSLRRCFVLDENSVTNTG